MSSILSFPDRGPWGNNKWRGNCSGHIYKELFTYLEPSFFVDPMVGGGTSVEVAKEMGIEAVGLDLHSGFDCLNDSILERVGRPADLVFSHPPYGEMIIYSGNQWGEAHPSDLSRATDDEDFHQKMQLVLLNQREATMGNGYYGCLIGDYRRKGRYTSYQAEIIARMPASELAGVIIKGQHNCMSDFKRYGKMTLPLITHEYIILFKKAAATSILTTLAVIANEAQNRLTGTWKNVVRHALIELGGKAALTEIYARVSAKAPDKLAANENWQAKVRQTLNQDQRNFRSNQRGEWALAA